MKYFYIVKPQYFPLPFIASYSWNGFGIRLKSRKEKNSVKFITVHSNKTRIIYKYGKKIDVKKYKNEKYGSLL